MDDCTVKCENCGNNYGCYMRTFYIQENGIKKCVCNDCRENLRKGKIWYTNYIPSFCDGGDVVTRIFDSIEQLNEYVNSKTDKDYIATFDDFAIVDVNKDHSEWWVRGFVSEKINLPEFYETIDKLGYK